MLTGLCVVALVCTLAVWATLRLALEVLERLGLDLMSVLLWLGLAEWPVEQPRSQRPRLGRLLQASPPSSG